MGKHIESFRLLEELGNNNGPAVDDSREGEEEISLLWSSLYKALYGTEKEAPVKFQFKLGV